MCSDPCVIFEGRSPIQIKWKSVVFKDTFKYVMSSLSSWAKQFGLKLLKGFFPHGFNLPENQNYVGPLPAEHFSRPNSCPKSITSNLRNGTKSNAMP